MSDGQAGGCGCGQGGQQPGCGCGRASATGVARDGAFTRPVFFDGQLLTSDDLQALVTYSRGKHRLHNRYVVGSGVVCGLEVVCSRTAPGSVVVRSGYALDCCGNDIVVACDQQVDLMELVARLSGDGCTDPCPPPTDAGEQGKPCPRRYELVIEYTETAGDLVAPYASGNESSRACEPTRYQEGYRFSLRCPDGRSDDPSGLVRALACCADAKRHLERLEQATSAARELAEAGREQIDAPPSSEELDEAMNKIRAVPKLPEAVRLASMAVRLAAAGDAAKAGTVLEEVRGMLARIKETAEDSLTSARVAALDQETESLAGRLEEPTLTRADRVLAGGVVPGEQVSGTLRSIVTEARDWALCWLEQRPMTHCQLAEWLEQFSVSADDQDKKLYESANKLTEAVRQLLLDCVCAAINPPCVPCEDVAVVLAEVTIDGCEVADICNLARRYPLTGTALRYWLPVDELLCEVERACCAEGDPHKALAGVRSMLGALGGRDQYVKPGLLAAANVGQAPHGEQAVQEELEEEPLSTGQHQLLKMLNSQVQSMQARMRKLERAAEEQAHAAEEKQHG